MKLRMVLAVMLLFALAFVMVGQAAQQKVVLYSTYDDPWWADMFAQFEKDTGIPLEVVQVPWGDTEKFATTYAGGTPPDVAIFDSSVIAWAAENNMLLDQRPFWQRDKAILNIDTIPLAAQKAVGADKGLSFPDQADASDAYFVWYDRNMFNDAGLAEPAMNWTYNDYYAYAKKLTKGEGAQKVYGSVPMLWEVVAEAAGGDLIDENGKYGMNKPAVYEAIDTAYDMMYRSEVIPRWGVIDGSWHDWLPAHRVAMHWAGTWYEYKVRNNVDWGIAMPPKGVARQSTRAFVGGLVIPNTAKNQAGAWEFIKWYQSDKVWRQRATQFTHVPWKPALQRQKDLLFWKVFGDKWAPILMEAMKVGRAVPFSSVAFQIKNILGGAVGEGPEANAKSTKQAFEEKQGEIEKLIADYNARHKK